jgi:hypothetical protein
MLFRSGPGAALLSDPQHRRSCKCVSFGLISSTRVPARFHALVCRCSNARRATSSELPGRDGRAPAKAFVHAGYCSTCPEAPASDCLAEAAGCLCCRSGRHDHVSAGCRAPVELSQFLQVGADEQISPCRHALQNPLRCLRVNVRFLQGDSRVATCAAKEDSLCRSVDSGAGEISCRFALALLPF